MWQGSAWGDGGAGCCGTDDGAHAVAVDASGTVFAVGHLQHAPAACDEDFAVIRFQPDGELWRALLDGGKSLSNISDAAWGVALTPGGSAFAAGRLITYELIPEGYTSEFTVTRLAASNGAVA